jgi:hypothetical protein
LQKEAKSKKEKKEMPLFLMYIVPTGVECVLVELEGILNCFARVAVAEIFKSHSCIGNQVARAKEASEYLYEQVDI